ncbi:MAG: S8 family serine peptidase, partial [Candidatus Zixiibacteriota bacterium]
LGTYKKPAWPELDIQKNRFEPEAPVADGMNYGSSAAQINQIKVNLLHSMGYHGEGVTLAILDTGFRKTHAAFSEHYAEGRVLAEHDFIFNDSNTANEPEDSVEQWTHGTLIWSVCGGESDGNIYGPAFKANFLLAKTEHLPTETPVEEDYWVAAVEWADSLGADVLTSSLGYIDWYLPSDLNGATAVTTLEANMAAAMGIVLCNAAGNGGPGISTLIAPADAFDILTVGSVNSFGIIANSSSRGPTADGRTKPEVCARGVSTWAATTGSDNSYGSASGTSLATPLVAGAACLMVQARPNYPPEVIRQAFMATAGNAGAPNNSYGWGVIDANAAVQWGAEFSADLTQGDAPLTVQFTANTSLAATGWNWTFG